MKEEIKINRLSSSLSSSPSSPSGRLTGLRSFCRPADLQVELGDLIEIDRTIYTHWGLYVGDGEIVHVSGPTSDISSSESFVRRSFLKEVAGDCPVRVNNKEVPAKERGLERLPLEEILSRSLNSVGQSVPYNFLTKNVEHYVTEWRYGVGWSDQANIALQTMSMFGNTLKDPHAAHHVLVMHINSILNAGHILSQRTESTHGTHH